MFQIGSSFFTEAQLLSEDFEEYYFIQRMLYLAFWGRFQLYKYISCWLITEGALIMFGFSHNGKDEHNVTKWNGCENVKLMLFENTKEFNHYIQSFNINTNNWVAQYIYKRLRFLGNRYLSQVSALVFLAVWHGFHSGYYMCFFMEFVIMFLEKDLTTVLEKNENVKKYFEQQPMKMILHIALRLYTFLFMGWCLAPFALLKFSKYWQVYRSVYYIGFIFFLPWPVLYKPILVALLRRSKKESEKIDRKIE